MHSISNLMGSIIQEFKKKIANLQKELQKERRERSSLFKKIQRQQQQQQKKEERQRQQYQKKLEQQRQRQEAKHQKELQRQQRQQEREFQKQRRKQLRQEQTKWAKEIRAEEAKRNRLQAKMDRKRGIFKAKATLLKSSLNGQAKDYFIKNQIGNLGLQRFLENVEPAAKKLPKPTSKVKFKLELVFRRLDAGKLVEEKLQFFSTKTAALMDTTQIDDIWAYAVDDLTTKLVEFETEKSGWRLKKIVGMHVQVSE